MDPFAPPGKNICSAVLNTCTGDLQSEFLTTMACGEEGAPC